MSPVTLFRRIVLPQAVRNAIPGSGNIWQLVLKESALISVIGLVELMRQAQIGAGSTRQPFSFFLTAAALYLVKQMQASGLAPGKGKSYYQPFDVGLSNLLGLAEGSDPALKQKTIVISAHYDHVGYGSARNSYGPFGYIHNGADDNASGVAALVECMEALSKLPQRPRRSILFCLWDGEEKGLLGSKQWVSDPTVPLANVALMFNVDMVGRLRAGRLEVLGTRTAAGMRQLVSRQNDDPAVWLDFNWEMKANSDHHTFFAKNIPVLMWHTGLHNNYHRPSDDVELINSEGLSQSARLLFKVLIALADADEISGFRSQAGSESPYNRQELESSLPALPGRLGVTWQQKPTPAEAIVVERVMPGGPAAKAGVRVGDRIVKLAGHELKDPEDLRSRVLAVDSPAEMIVQRPGQEEPVTLNVELRGGKVRVGITWREDAGEPGTLVIDRVVPGSPADRAGIKVADRIYEIAGRKFKSTAEFLNLSNEQKSPIEMLVETRGQVRTVKVELVQ